MSQASKALFVVGMPRSGTKLLRGLLNRHANISIPNIETEFLPYWVSHWAEFGDLSSRNKFIEFYKQQMHIIFFVYARERGSLIDPDMWYSQCENFDPASVFEALIRHQAGIIPGSEDIIWGDKSPSYIHHVPLLLSLYPQAMCIHIVRDVRDYCLSIHAAWGKNMLRAAQRWRDSVTEVHAVACQNPDRVLEIRYEDLLEHTDQVMERISSFLGVEFHSDMLSPGKETENLGAAKGRSDVVRHNRAKYLTEMPTYVRKSLERVSRDMLGVYGYPVNGGEVTRVPLWRMYLLQLLDGVNLVRAEAKERGLIKALGFHLSNFKTTGNRKMREEP